MAVLLYHTFAFLALFSYGIYHLVCATRSFFKPTSSSARSAVAGTGDYISRPYYPLLLPCHVHHLLRHFPLYLALFTLIISISYHASLSSASPNSFSSLHTSASLVFFLLLTIALFLPIQLAPDLIFLLAAVGFSLLALASSAYKPSDLQSKCDSVSSSISALCAAFSVALAFYPRLFVAEFALAASISLQGLWSLQTGLALYVERFTPEGCHRLLEVTDGSIRCELDESRIRAAALLDLAFVLHTTFVSVIAVAVYASVAWWSGGGLPRRYNGGSYEPLPTSSSSGGLSELDHVQMKVIHKNSMQA
ncbi:hypothetical protein KSP39_PZI011389 [Platanthera zijinensis]|uniref:Uncharacterized protein n=1 Tax=Platanthera zijinensis TaxID=2320716 RepID=A0AAP0BGT9_9ASPA